MLIYILSDEHLFIRKWDGTKIWAQNSLLVVFCDMFKWHEISKEKEKEKENTRKKAISRPMDRKLEVPNYVILFKMDPLFDTPFVHASLKCHQVETVNEKIMFICLYIYLLWCVSYRWASLMMTTTTTTNV